MFPNFQKETHRSKYSVLLIIVAFGCNDWIVAATLKPQNKSGSFKNRRTERFRESGSVISLLDSHIRQRASQAALVVKNPPANAEDMRDSSLIPGLGRSPAGGHSNLLQYSCLEESYGQKNLMGYSPQGLREQDMTEAI